LNSLVHSHAGGRVDPFHLIPYTEPLRVAVGIDHKAVSDAPKAA
tara:strand:+ start:1028 stop:1159 length:132 start_codon:yes stop_codon:yes gene_type:complete